MKPSGEARPRATAAILFRLFFEMLKVALFVVGGGYAIIAAADDVFSRRLKWTREGELVESLSLFQTFPGIMAGHCAVYVGRKVAGTAGSAVALAAVILPSLVVFLAVSMGYGMLDAGNAWLAGMFGGLRAGMTGILAAMTLRVWPKSVPGARGLAVFALSLAALACGTSPALVLVAAMLAGVTLEFAPGRRGPRRFFSLGAVVPLFFKYGALAFGGGYVLVPMYIRDFVGPSAPYLQLPAHEFSNLMALTQMTPGPIGINAATFFGYRLAGIPGACLATAALVVPGAVLLSLALASLERFSGSRAVKGVLSGARPASVALMVSATVSFAEASFLRLPPPEGALPVDFAQLAVALLVAAGVFTRRIGVMKAVLASAAAGLAEHLLFG